MTTQDLHSRVRRELEKATFKIITENNALGTGFFISPDGYFLTAYHCVKDMLVSGKTDFFLTLEFFNGGVLRDEVRFDTAKSDKKLDLAVIKVNYEPRVCLPLGRLSRADIETHITALGYPSGDKKGRGLGFYAGTVSRFIEDTHLFETSVAIQGEGQSGGPVYHYGTQRVIGLAHGIYEPMKNAGLAARFDPLFQVWPELEIITAETAGLWDSKFKISRPGAKCKPLFAKLCNRHEQRNQFWHFFIRTAKDCPDRPQFYFIHGGKGQGHESFIERMTKEHIEKYAADNWREEQEVVIQIKARWPELGNLEDRQNSLKMGIFLEFNKGYANPECALDDLQDICSKNQFVIICHDIDASKWKKADEELLRWYMGKDCWAGFKCQGDIPRFLIFFTVKYAASGFVRFMENLKKKLGCYCFSKERIDILAREAEIPCLPGIEMTPIDQGHLEEWFYEYKQCIREEDPKVIQSILKRCRTAEEIEKALEEIINA